MNMEYGKAFTFPQEDPEWLKKWAIAGVIALIPVIGPIVVTGYGVAIARRVIHNEPRLLPEWSDFADFAIKGLVAFVIRLAYALPLLVVGVCAAIPFVGLALAQSAGADVQRLLDQAGGFLGVCFGCVGIAYGLLAVMMTEAAVGRYAATGQIAEAFRVREVLGMVRTRPGMYLIVTLLIWLAAMLFSTLGVIACVVGAFWGAAYVALAAGHLTGQAYRHVTTAPPAA